MLKKKLESELKARSLLSGFLFTRFTIYQVMVTQVFLTTIPLSARKFFTVAISYSLK